VQNAKDAASTSTETVMLRQAATIISTRSLALAQTGDFHDVTGHHRYYGSSACNGGERITETRRGPRPQGLNVCGF
jgi:hypothetical protein